MQNLTIHNVNFLTFSDDLLTVDVLGGIDLLQVERMISTLRITYQDYPPYRTTLDLYNDNQVEKLLRSLCDKWELKLFDVSPCIHRCIARLEDYRLRQLKYTSGKAKPNFELTKEEEKQALKTLKNKNLIQKLTDKLNDTGIIGEDENAIILFLALSTYKFDTPFSVLCLAKSGIGKSYILQKLSECMPDYAYSFHTQISANALYYFNSEDINNKALIIEDLEWTIEMLSPLATLHSQGKLVKTRATKNRDGVIHSTTFEVTGNLCLLACAYSSKKVEELSLPFLLLDVNHSQSQDISIMEYQKKCKAGIVNLQHAKAVQRELQCLIATLKNVSVINPFAELINLPKDIAHPRKTLMILLDFVEVITYIFQYQRKQIVDKNTGQVSILTTTEDIKLTFKLLKHSLFRRADELSVSTRGFYNWLSKLLTETKTNQFTALDIRKTKTIHPRTLNRYLQELKLYNYIQIIGGNKYRGGFVYKLNDLGNQSDVNNRIEQDLNEVLEKIKEKAKTVGQLDKG